MSKFPVANKVQDSQPKLSPSPEFPVADKAWFSTKTKKTLKYTLAKKARDSQPKLSPRHDKRRDLATQGRGKFF